MLNMACTLFKLTPEETLLGVTRNAALALGLQDTHGQIKAGMRADFVHWSIDELDELSYYIGHNPCNLIIKNGHVSH